jgi:hypothetical protein
MAQYSIYVLYWGAPALGTFPHLFTFQGLIPFLVFRFLRLQQSLCCVCVLLIQIFPNLSSTSYIQSGGKLFLLSKPGFLRRKLEGNSQPGRVTRLADFSSIGRLLPLGNFFENYRNRRIFWDNNFPHSKCCVSINFVKLGDCSFGQFFKLKESPNLLCLLAILHSKRCVLILTNWVIVLYGSFLNYRNRLIFCDYTLFYTVNDVY